MSEMSELDIEANEAFYEWEKETGRTDLSDRDREIWCQGFIQGRLSAKGFY